jgi:hypothetical protein
MMIRMFLKKSPFCIGHSVGGSINDQSVFNGLLASFALLGSGLIFWGGDVSEHIIQAALLHKNRGKGHFFFIGCSDDAIDNGNLRVLRDKSQRRAITVPIDDGNLFYAFNVNK